MPNEQPPIFLAGKHWTEIGEFKDMTAKYPIDMPEVMKGFTIPVSLIKLVLIRAASLTRWNLYLHEPIIVNGDLVICVGCMDVRIGSKRTRVAAALIEKAALDTFRREATDSIK